MIGHGNPDRHQNLRPDLVRKAENGLHYLLGPNSSLAHTDPQRRRGDGDKGGRGAGVEPGDNLHSTRPHDLMAFSRSLQITMMAGALFTKPGHACLTVRTSRGSVTTMRCRIPGLATCARPAAYTSLSRMSRPGRSGVKTRCIRRRRIASNTACTRLLPELDPPSATVRLYYSAFGRYSTPPTRDDLSAIAQSERETHSEPIQ